MTIWSPAFRHVLQPVREHLLRHGNIGFRVYLDRLFSESELRLRKGLQMSARPSKVPGIAYLFSRNFSGIVWNGKLSVQAFLTITSLAHRQKQLALPSWMSAALVPDRPEKNKCFVFKVNRVF